MKSVCRCSKQRARLFDVVLADASTCEAWAIKCTERAFGSKPGAVPMATRGIFKPGGAPPGNSSRHFCGRAGTRTLAAAMPRRFLKNILCATLAAKSWRPATNQRIRSDHMRRIPTHLRLLKGNPSKRPIPAEPEPDVPENMPEPPAFLAPYARDEWWEVGPHLLRLRLLRGVDLTCFAAYCQSYAMWRTAIEALAQMAERGDATPGGLLVKRVSDGSPMRNPLLAIATSTGRRTCQAARSHHPRRCGREPVCSLRHVLGKLQSSTLRLTAFSLSANQ